MLCNTVEAKQIVAISGADLIVILQKKPLDILHWGQWCLFCLSAVLWGHFEGQVRRLVQAKTTNTFAKSDKIYVPVLSLMLSLLDKTLKTSCC